MSITERIAIMSLTILAASLTASSVPACTSSETSLVPASAVSPPADPTMARKGKLRVDDKGRARATLAGVTDAGGSKVTTSTSYKMTGVLDGTEYVTILKGTFTATGVPFEVAIPADLNSGTGVGKLSLSALFGTIAPGVGRSIEVTGGEVWGPLGVATLAACQAVVNAGYDPVPGDTACRQGTMIGVSGINIPVP